MTSCCPPLLIINENESHLVVSDSLQPHGLYSPWNFPGQNTGEGSLFFLQGIFPTQELNRGLLHCRRILYQLSYEGSPPPNYISQLFLHSLAPASHKQTWKTETKPLTSTTGKSLGRIVFFLMQAQLY